MKNKIAEISIYFWILKVLATTIGETLGDALSMTMNLGYVVSFTITGIACFTLIFIQVALSRYNALAFWLAIIGTTTFGTEISDMLDRTFELGYLYGSIILSSGLLIIFSVWYFMERNLKVEQILDCKTEIMFWITVLFSNSLGTAFGDLLSDDIGFSYAQGAMITSAIIIVVLLLHYYTKLNSTILFWVAFIFTRPFGATFGDFLTKPIEKGGFNLGTIQASCTAMIIFLFVLAISKKVKTGGSVQCR